MYLEAGKISELMRGGRLVLLFKKSDISDLRNYRLFTMLNLDYKILTKTMTNKL